jgi:hypothetical protein
MRRVGPASDDAAMSTVTRPSRPTNLFLLERFWPGVTTDSAVDAAASLAAAAAASSPGRVRHLRSGIVPADEVVWSMVEADSEAAVIAVTTLARYPVDRISATIVVGGKRR